MGGMGGTGTATMYTEEKVRERIEYIDVEKSLSELEPSNNDLADLPYADGIDRDAAPVIRKMITKPDGVEKQEDIHEMMESLGAIHPEVFKKLDKDEYTRSSGPRYDKETKEMLEDGNYRQVLERWDLR